MPTEIARAGATRARGLRSEPTLSPATSSPQSRIETTLAGIDDATLDRITEGGSVFFGRRWLRLIESLDLAALAKGELELRFVVTTLGAETVAVCPFFATRSPSIYLFYSLEKFFFSAWWRAGVEQQAPELAGTARWAETAVGLCARLARLSRAGIKGWILAASPLSHRGGVAIAPLDESERARVGDATLACLQGVASDAGLPLCFLGIPEDDELLRAAFERRSFEAVFVGYDNVLSLESPTFDGYLGRFKSDARRLFTREMKAARDAGITFETTPALGALGATLDQLYEATARRYGAEHFHHPPEFWTALERHLGPEVEAVVARDRGGAVVGFSLLLLRGQDVWFHRVGRRYDGVPHEAAVYFNLAFYEPVKRALERGATRLWLGFGSWEAKRRRGARAHTIASAFWFPSRWSRALLVPYLRVFGRVGRGAMSDLARPSSYLKVSA